MGEGCAIEGCAISAVGGSDVELWRLTTAVAVGATPLNSMSVVIILQLLLVMIMHPFDVLIRTSGRLIIIG